MDPRGSRFPILRESTQDRVPIGLLIIRQSAIAIRHSSTPFCFLLFDF